MSDLNTISRRLEPRPMGQPKAVGGGCIHTCYQWGDYFIKTNQLTEAANFAAEATGLQAVGATGAIRVPEVILQGTEGKTAFLVLERLDLVSQGDDNKLGTQLAALHSHTAPEFGFQSDNFIGASPQPNDWGSSWAAFFAEHRIEHQLRLLASRGTRIPNADLFLERLPAILPSAPSASLIHGDLWAGNKAYLTDGTPVVFDPAVHHADPECDIAMTDLFGGFSEEFIAAYRSVRPAPDGESELHEIYRLYHLLNHALLFGGAYLGQAVATVRRFT